MNTQTLLEEKIALLNETKELTVDESQIFGGVDTGWEISDVMSKEYKKGSSFLG